jgi:hypothetical protein
MPFKNARRGKTRHGLSPKDHLLQLLPIRKRHTYIFNWERLHGKTSFGDPLTSKCFLMKNAITLLSLIMAMSFYSHAAAKYKPPFYERAMAAIHEPALGNAKQETALPPVVLTAEVPADNPRHWYHGPQDRAKATWGTVLLVMGGVFLAAGIGVAIVSAAAPRTDGWDEIRDAIGLFIALILGVAGIGMSIPGYILRKRYGR